MYLCVCLCVHIYIEYIHRIYIYICIYIVYVYICIYILVMNSQFFACVIHKEAIGVDGGGVQLVGPSFTVK